MTAGDRRRERGRGKEGVGQTGRGAHPSNRQGSAMAGRADGDVRVLGGTVGVEEADEGNGGVVGDSVGPAAIPRIRT